MFQLRWLTLSLLLISIFTDPASPQTRAFLVFGHGGRTFPLTRLSGDGDDLGPGKAFGGGVGLQIGSGTALRASVNITESNYRGPTLNLGNSVFKRSYCGVDLMFGTALNVGLVPYFFFGGGRVTVDPAEPGTDTLARLAGRLGTGVNYVPDNSPFALFAEVGGWLYHFDLLGFNEVQLDLAVTGGLAFAVPF